MTAPDPHERAQPTPHASGGAARPGAPRDARSPAQPEPAAGADGAASAAEEAGRLVAARRANLEAMRSELGLKPYGGRVDGLVDLAAARALFNEQSHAAYESAKAAAKGDPQARPVDDRAVALVAGRVMQHRDLGKLVFLWLRDHSGDLQVSISRDAVPAGAWDLAKRLDYGDVVVAGGRIGRTQKGETCVWADRLEIHAKSLAPPPEKFHGLADPEIRYRRRYVDMYANPGTMEVFKARSRMVSQVRRFMEGRGFMEVETPMMQPIAGGAAARPFKTHHNALGIPLYLRIAPELYLKRLLVGGMPRVFEVNRNFRNEGVDRSHNPEFTMMEAYQAFGDCWTMLELTEALVHHLAVETAAAAAGRGAGSAPRQDTDAVPSGGPVLPFGELRVDYSRPFARVAYGELFRAEYGFDMHDEGRVRQEAVRRHVPEAAGKDHWLLVDLLFEAHAEKHVDPSRPTFITDYPAAISPLTRPNPADETLAERWDLFIAGMEIGPAYTELNDPDVQRRKFTEQLRGLDEEATTFRTLDEDFLESLLVGMPPAGGLGLGIDRLVMLMTNQPSIRDVVLFPHMRPQ